MRRSLSVLFLILTFVSASLSQQPAASDDVRAMADEALAKSRAGQMPEALQLYKRALAAAPEDIAILRDFAVVLGWDEQYKEAIPVIRKLRLLQNDQPDWALQEFARTYLFGDATGDALQVLDELVARGDHSEQTLSRRALALRWLGRSDEARFAYVDMRQRYPANPEAITGLAYVLADQNKLSEALRTLELSPDVSPNELHVLKARVRILNWMGRHYEAQRLIETLPSETRDDRDVLEDRIAAARWGGNPSMALQDVIRLTSLFTDPAAQRLSGDLRTEYGHSLSPGFRFSKDSDGLIDRTAALDTSFHLSPAHVLRVGYQYRWLEQQDIRTLIRYDLGWSGTLHRRLDVSATVSSVDYRKAGINNKIVGDASFSIVAGDALRLNVGGGTTAVDAYQAIGKRIQAPFGFAGFAYGFSSRTRLQMRYSRYEFSNSINRDRADLEFTQSLLAESKVRLTAGWRSNLMWHNDYTEDFYSPAEFQSHLAMIRAEGGITSWLAYAGEVAIGWQMEADAPTLNPLQTSAKIMWTPTKHWRWIVEGGKSTSSLERAATGTRIYSRWVASGTMEFRFP